MADPLDHRPRHARRSGLPARRDARRRARRRAARTCGRSASRASSSTPSTCCGGPGARVVQAAGGIHRFMDWDRPIVSDSGGFQVWSLIRQDPEPRRHPRQRGDLPRAVDRREVEPDAGADREPPAPARQRRRRLPRRLHRCGRARGRAGALRRAHRALGAPLPRRARSPGRAARRRGPADLRRRPGRRGRGAAAAVRDRAGRDRLRRLRLRRLAAGRPTARCSPSRCAGSPSRCRPTAPKHALGVGRPDHVVTAFALGYSVFDCALPTRDARHGRLYAFRDGWSSRRPAPGDDFYRAVRIHDAPYRVAHGPIEDGCDCPVCARHSAAYLHHLFKVGDRRPSGWRRSTTCASTSASSSCSARSAQAWAAACAASSRPSVSGLTLRARARRSVSSCSAIADASSEPATRRHAPGVRQDDPAGRRLVGLELAGDLVADDRRRPARRAPSRRPGAGAPARGPPAIRRSATDDEPGPAGDGREVAVEDGLELERGRRQARPLADLERQLAGGDRIVPGAGDDQPIGPGQAAAISAGPCASWLTSSRARIAAASSRDRRSFAASATPDDERRQVADGVAPALVLLLGGMTWSASAAPGDPGPTVISAVVRAGGLRGADRLVGRVRAALVRDREQQPVARAAAAAPRAPGPTAPRGRPAGRAPRSAASRSPSRRAPTFRSRS